VVFSDEYGSNVTFQAFENSKYDAVSVDATEKYDGSASLRVTVPGPGDPTGTYAGGAFTTSMPRDLTGYNALTFWARASQSITLDVAGFGNNNTGTSLYQASLSGIPITTTWTRVTIPFPLPEKLGAEDGLFFFAEGAEGDTGYSIWFDEIQFESVGTISNPQPEIASAELEMEVGGSASVTGTGVTFSVGGTPQFIAAMPSYFTFSSSNESVATVGTEGVIQVVGEGDATISASLGGTAASGEVSLSTYAPPSQGPETPTLPAEEVISLFSDAYTDRAVDTWSAEWDMADVEDVTIGGDAVKRYSNLGFAGIEFTSQPVDAAAGGLTHLHVDLWLTDATEFKVKLVDFGADGAFGGGDDSEYEITLTEAAPAASGPSLSSTDLVAKEWIGVDLPLADFAGLAGTSSLAQMILSGSSTTVYLDNLYFYQGAPPAEPTVAAPTPTFAEDDVISLFSGPYTDVTVDTWSPDWDQADVADVQIAGDDTKVYRNLAYAVIDFSSQTIDASGMTHFHMHIWTPDPAATGDFKVKLVDFGADGAWSGGDDTEHELTFDALSTPALVTGSWITLDLPLSDFTNLAATDHMAQMVISGTVNTVYVDNVLFHR
jgi:hypothetical protein